MPWAHFVIGLLGFAILLAWYAGKRAGYDAGFKDGLEKLHTGLHIGRESGS